jgi:CRISPR/Cas system-associated protein Csm6
MVSNMKTTIEISDALLEEARKLAAQEQTTLRALVSEGLRRIIAERKKKEAFKLRKVTFQGQGLQPHLAGASWEQIRDLAYEGRGG